MESLIYKSGISIVIPTFNESKNILFLINNLISQFKENNVEIIVVDDNSNDGTAEIVKEASISDPRIRLIPRVGRSGLSSAIKEGLLAAKYNIGGVIDGDGQVQAEDLKKAVLLLFKEKLDIVIGSRFLNDSKRSGLSNKRSLASSAANYLCRLSLPKNYSHITDYQSISMAINLNKGLHILIFKELGTSCRDVRTREIGIQEIHNTLHLTTEKLKLSFHFQNVVPVLDLQLITLF